MQKIPAFSVLRLISVSLFVLFHFLAESPIAQGTSPITVKEALRDQDRNYIPDRLGETVELIGVLTSAPIVVGEQGSSLANFQDATGGIVLFGTDTVLTRGHLQPGDLVRVTGKISQFRGMEELQVAEIRRVSSGMVVHPRDVSTVDLHSELYSGQLVRLKGHLKIPPNYLTEKLVLLQDRSGEIPIFIPARFFTNPKFVDRLLKSGAVELVGVAGQYCEERPFNSGYRLVPRTPDDFVFAPLPQTISFSVVMVRSVLLFGSLIVFLGVTSYLWLRRRSAERLALEMTRLSEGLKRSEKALAVEKEGLSVTLRSIGDGVITTDIEGNILLVNKVAESLVGWSQEEAAGKPLAEIYHVIDENTRECYQNPLEEVLRGAAFTDFGQQKLLIARNGTERVIAESRSPIQDKGSSISGLVLVFRDITEQLKTQEERLKAGKLESVGLLAGGIAHDFNNILTAVLGNLSLAKTLLDEKDEIVETLADAEKACLRAKDLTRQLLTFSKGGAPIKTTTSIAELMKECASFALRGSNVRGEFSIPDDLRPAEIDAGQMSQVINNLIINARQAMPQGGTLRIRCEDITVTGERVVHGLALPENHYLQISIEDQGIGIPKEYLHRIFDPYFTTKQEGSGLGLATSYSIIKNHGGYIAVESELGVGTTFYFYLPTSQKKMPARTQVENKPIHGSGKILVMDDEEFVRTFTSKALPRFGYEVILAKDGAEAIELYKRAKTSGQPFDAVIMDLTVPGGIGGKEAMKELLGVDPEVKAIVSSGYSADPVTSNFRQYGFRGCVAKPYTVQKLSEALREVIAGTAEDHCHEFSI